MNNGFKSEFSWKKLGLDISQGQGGSESFSLNKSWILPPVGLAVVRALLAVFCVTIIIISGVRQGEAKWFIFLTNWSFFFLTIAMIGLCLVSIIYLCEKSQQNQEDRNLTWYQQVAWFFWAVGSNAAIIITLLYWTLIFSPPTSFMDVAVHALNTVVMLIEFFVNSIPVRILHALYPMIVAAIYSIFVVIYWAAGGENDKGKPYVYEVLNFEDDPKIVVAILVVTTLVVTPLVQLLLFALHKVKFFFKK